MLYVDGAGTVVDRFSRQRFSGKFQFNRKFEKFAATKCGSSALQKFDLVENFDLIEKFAVTNFSTKSVLHCNQK